MKIIRSRIVACALVASTGIAHAQTASPDHRQDIRDALVGLATKHVFLTDSHGTETSGTVVSANLDTVTLRIKQLEVEVPYATIAKVERQGDSPWEGAAGVGALAALWAAMGMPRYGLSLGETFGLFGGFALGLFAVDVVEIGRTTVYVATSNVPVTAGGPSQAHPMGVQAMVRIGF